MAVPLQRAMQAWNTFMALLTAVLVTIGVALNVVLWAMVIRPVTALSKIADQVSLGDVNAPSFATHSKDEIGLLAQSFTRMRRSLSKAMAMLENPS
jgi:protein-histidine pros-kinase